MKDYAQRLFALLAGAVLVSSCGARSQSPVVRDYQRPTGPGRITPQSLCVWQNGHWNCGGSSTQNPCDITSTTYATSPANRSRTTLGVAEQVTLTTTLGFYWSISSDNGSALSASTGSSVTLTAGSAAGSATITLRPLRSLCTESQMPFQIIAPSYTSYYAASKRHLQGYTDVGALSNVYIGPDTVSFENIWFDEADAYYSATGVWYPCFNGHDHEPGPIAIKVGSEVPGYGSELSGGAQDTEDTGACTGNQLVNSSESVNIPTQWSAYGSGWNLINVVTQSATGTTAGAASITKDHAHETANIGDTSVGEH